MWLRLQNPARIVKDSVIATQAIACNVRFPPQQDDPFAANPQFCGNLFIRERIFSILTRNYYQHFFSY